jgi:hypothetical protein
VLTDVALAVALSVGATTVTPSVALAVAVPAVAARAMVPVPGVAVVEGTTVAVEVPPGLMLAGLNVTVTPAGAVALRAIRPVKPLVAPADTVNEVDWPWKDVTEEEFGVKVRVGTVTVNPTDDVALDSPAVPFKVIAPVPPGAVAEAKTVAVEVAPGTMLAGLNVTLTPLGAVADSAMGEVYPLAAPTVT